MNKNNSLGQIDAPIGFFDSGVGGLTVFSKVKKLLPSENYIYFGDTKNMPYGEKSPEVLVELTKKAFDFFQSKGAKAVVMACNTTSAVAFDVVKDDYDFVIYPIIQSVAKLISAQGLKRIGVFATPATINSHAYSKEIKEHTEDVEVFEIACPEWVKIVEENRLDCDESVKLVQAKLTEIKKFSPEKIVLGCTHYPYLLGILSKLMPVEDFIDPSKDFAEFVKSDLKNKGLLNVKNNSGIEEFFVSTEPDKFQQSGRLFYEIEDLPKII
ncbi:MAG: glutamate racemase [Candidatus Gastranaerophilales bacterium]